MKPTRLLLPILALTSYAAVSCSDHDHDHDHGDHDHAAAHTEDHGDEHDHGDEDHGHHHAGEAGPNGGRVIASMEPHLEFLVTGDRKVQLTALDDDLKAIPLGTLGASLTGGDRSNPTRMTFATEGNSLISDVAFPEGNDFPVILQVKTAPDTEPATERFNLNLAECPDCENLEYACTCDHEH